MTVYYEHRYLIYSVEDGPAK